MITAKTKRWLYPLFAFIGISLVFAVFGGIKACSIMSMMKAFANMKPPAVSVSAATARTVEWRPSIQAIGSITAVNGVDVSSELSGKVAGIKFQSGDEVKQGQLLVQLDDSQEQALLRQYQAQEKLDKNNFDRALSLRKKNLNSKQDLDNARTQYEMSQAQVAQEQAVIAKKAIRAPFTGVVGIRQVNLGQYVNAGTAIVNLEQLDPLYITFTLPQADVPRLHLNQDVELQVDGYTGRTFTGTLSAINPAVNSQSRMLQAQATVPNPKHLLRPGMFANVQVLGEQSKQVIAVPTTAITYSLYGDSVYVLEKQKDGAPTGKTGAKPATSAKAATAGTAAGAAMSSHIVYSVKQVFVQVGQVHDGMVAVTGIKPGTLVVTAGQIKLHPGSSAVINNSVDLSKVPELTP
jgi:membrane fusion protein, multidrug efflux system